MSTSQAVLTDREKQLVSALLAFRESSDPANLACMAELIVLHIRTVTLENIVSVMK